jgi:hypothetical protein
MASKGTSVTAYIYTGKDKSDWAHLWSAFKLNLIEKDIAYIMVEAEVTQRLQPPEIPIPVAIPAEENVNERTVREFQQDLAMNEYKELAKLHRKYTKEVPKDYKVAEKVLLDLLAKPLKEDMTQFMDGPVYNAVVGEQLRYNALWNYLHKKYGPYFASDVAKLRQKLMDMDGDADGWRNAYHMFNQTVATMQAIPKRDGAGNPLVVANIQLNWRPQDDELKVYLQQALERSKNPAFKDIWYRSIQAVNQAWTYLSICQEIEAYLQYEQQTDPHSERKSKVAYSAKSSDNDSNPRKRARTATSDAKKPADDRKCKNCGKSHMGQRCTSTKCGVCGKNFSTTQERFNHWVETHKVKNGKYEKNGNSNTHEKAKTEKINNSQVPQK